MRFRRTLFLAGTVVIALGGCGEDGPAESAAPPKGGQPAVTIGVSDFAFHDVPRTIMAGTPITITNTSSKEAHELTAFRLPDNEARPLAEIAALPPAELGALLPGAPNLALFAAPQSKGQLVLGDGSLHEPGRYLLVCFIPVGARPGDVLPALMKAAANPEAGPPQIDRGPPHVTAGMIAEIEVLP